MPWNGRPNRRRPRDTARAGRRIDVECGTGSDDRRNELGEPGDELVAISAVQVRLAAVDVLDDEDRAVERVQLEVLELLAEHRDVEQ